MFVFQRIVVGIAVQTIKAVVGGSGGIDADADNMVAVLWFSDSGVDLAENIFRKKVVPIEGVIITALQQLGEIGAQGRVEQYGQAPDAQEDTDYSVFVRVFPKACYETEKISRQYAPCRRQQPADSVQIESL